MVVTTRSAMGSTPPRSSSQRPPSSRSVSPRSSSTSTAAPTTAHSALVLAASIGLVAIIAAAGAAIGAPGVDGWYEDAAKPMFTPPNAIFGPVWGVLYLSMAIAAWLVWRRPPSLARTRALRIYAVQLALNALWTPAFFGLGAVIGATGLWIALVVIVLLDFAILAAIIRFSDVSRVAATLLVPYWLWVLFATTLNAAMAVLAT